MTESNKHSESGRLVVYQQESEGIKMCMIFNKETKAVDIAMLVFHKLNKLNPDKSRSVFHEEYGYWQAETPCLGLEDIEFLHNKAKELFCTEQEGVETVESQASQLYGCK